MSVAIERPTNVRYFVLIGLLVITAINYVQRNCISPVMTTIEKDLALSGPALDLISGAFFLSYTFLQIPAGKLAERWGARLALPTYAVGWSLSLLAYAFATGFLGLYLGRLSMGAFQAGIFPCATLILAVWFPASQRGTATALLNSFMLIGSASGIWLAGYLIAPLGWRGLFQVYAVPGLVWSVWFLWWFRNTPAEHPSVNEAERKLLEADRPAVKPGVVAPFTLALLLSLPLWLLCVQQAFRAAANRLFDSRLSTYLEKEREVPVDVAARMASWPQWAGVVGGIFGGSLSDLVLARTRSRRLARNGVAIFSLLSCSVVYALAYLIADVTLSMLVLSIGAFLFCFSSPCAYALSIDIGGRYLAIVFGMMNMIGNLGAYAFVSGIMAMVSFGGWPLAFGVWIGLHVVAIVCWFFLNPDVSIGDSEA